MGHGYGQYAHVVFMIPTKDAIGHHDTDLASFVWTTTIIYTNALQVQELTISR
jgi:hypothetical protein